jgi:hypothetical protein
MYIICKSSILILKKYIFEYIFFKLGGLDGRDQSRSRSRTSFVSRLTFENRRDYPSRRDQLLKVSRSRVSIEISTKIEILGHKPCRDFVFWTVENVLHVETNFWKPSRMSIMSRSTFENRRDRESRSRPCRDKSRPPSLIFFQLCNLQSYLLGPFRCLNIFNFLFSNVMLLRLKVFSVIVNIFNNVIISSDEKE